MLKVNVGRGSSQLGAIDAVSKEPQLKMAAWMNNQQDPKW